MLKFTSRENQILECLLQGLNNKQIAKALGITEKTVIYHTGHMYDKCGVNSRTQLIYKLFKEKKINLTKKDEF